jgi:hypothetical protein
MDQKYVYHRLNHTSAPRARVASAKLAASEVFTYVALFTGAVLIAFVAFSFAMSVKAHASTARDFGYAATNIQSISQPDAKTFSLGPDAGVPAH